MKMPPQKPHQSKQDFGTPREFINAVEAKFGKITFDLAAHAGNKVCDNYFAPKELKIIYDPKKSQYIMIDDLVQEFVRQGAEENEVREILNNQYNQDSQYGIIHFDHKTKIIVPNRDKNCRAFDSLSQDWSKLSGNLWLNPEYEDIGPWAEKCYNLDSLDFNERVAKNQDGYITKILFLIPSSTGTEYWKNYIHKKSLVNFLSPRISFDSISPYPKDLSLIVWGINADFNCWRWK